MRRVVLSIVGTIAGLGALLSFKTHPGPAIRCRRPGRWPERRWRPRRPARHRPSAAPSGAASCQQLGPAPHRRRSTAAPAQQTLAGQAVQTRYGTVQVQVVLSGSSIQSVGFLQLTADDPRSQEINSQAAPILVQQTMQVQSANIDGVSGATYTSEGYQQSLQSALDQAGVK